MIASVIVSWLIAFDVLNIRNPRVAQIVEFLNKLTEPLFRPFRKIIPPLGGIDVSPVAVILAIYFLQETVHWLSM